MLVLGGYFIGCIYTLPDVPGPYISKYHLHFFHLYVWLTVVWFISLTRSNPGVITKENVKVYSKHYAFDNQIYFPKYCTTCKIDRPARSKHCNVCGKCVARFDHHCAWVNTDIGRNNLWKFLVFLWNTGFVCGYCGWICYQVLWGFLHSRGLEDFIYEDNYGVSHQLSFSVIMPFVIYHRGPTAALCMFTSIMSFVLYIFLLYHLYLIKNNTTTQETFRWGDLTHNIKKRDYLKKRNRSRNNSKYPKPISKSQRKKENEMMESLRHLPKLEDLDNIYNNGFISNLKEVFSVAME
eukprot:TRINITY_DN2834_c0_g1_i3.p1 TRINITY_DN2834_c0_g1~~TRINITY_DN2834_c0_g1_i3.p1  ORF type:complete len:294 (-),score=41.62 TRINITY_DN2834_c0_g1_i3:27-908(-)